MPEAVKPATRVLLELDPENPVILIGLANLRFLQGQVKEAITLYERAAVLIDSAVVMFDLAQAYARSFQMERFEAGPVEGAVDRCGGRDPAVGTASDPDFVANLPLPSEVGCAIACWPQGTGRRLRASRKGRALMPG